MKTEPIQIWDEYQKLVQYVSKHNLYETVKENENFYIGKQWEGVNADSMPKPVVNILQRVVKYMVSTIGSSNISVSITPFTAIQDDIRRMEPVSKEVDNIIENAKIIEKSKLSIRNAAVDGSSYIMLEFNPDFETNQDMKGRIEAKVVDNTQVYFGNPYSNDIQTQPYIIIALRQYIESVKKEAKDNGVPEDEINSIYPDNDGTQSNDDSTDLVTVLIKFYKHRSVIEEISEETDLEGNVIQTVEKKTVETVWFTKTTKDLTIIKPTDLGYSRYPVACFGWDIIKNSYLYTSPMTAVIPNQKFINKTYGMTQLWISQNAMPKVMFDKTKLDITEFMNSVSPNAVASLPLADKAIDWIKPPDISSQTLPILENIITQTKECMGVNDAALGNVDPDNTSAIIQLQEAASVPLEIQRQNFYGFWEDIVRNLLDIMGNTYGVRQVMTQDNELAFVDFSLLKGMNYNLRVDIGQGAQYSEIAQINTLDKLLEKGLIVNPKTYVEAIPDKYILAKGKIMADLDEAAQNPIPAETPVNRLPQR